MRRWLIILALSAVFSSSACYSYRYSGAIRPMPPATEREEIPLFSYDKSVAVPYLFTGKVEDHGKYVVREIKWRVKDFPEMKNKYAKGYFYEPKDKSVKTPGLLVLPPTGGPFTVVKTFAAYFADRGFTVAALRRREAFFNPKKDLAYNEKLIRQAVIDARRAIDFLDTLDYVDHDKTCLIGISLGGIVGVLTMETDGRVKAGGFHVTAGHLSDILMTSGFMRVANFRETVMKELNVGPDQLRESAEKVLRPMDPVTYADRLDPGRIVMINGAFDDIVTREVVMETYESYGRPQQYFVPAGHYLSIGFCGYGNKKIYDHFVKVLSLDSKTAR